MTLSDLQTLDYGLMTHFNRPDSDHQFQLLIQHENDYWTGNFVQNIVETRLEYDFTDPINYTDATGSVVRSETNSYVSYRAPQIFEFENLLTSEKNFQITRVLQIKKNPISVYQFLIQLLNSTTHQNLLPPYLFNAKRHFNKNSDALPFLNLENYTDIQLASIIIL